MQSILSIALFVGVQLDLGNLGLCNLELGSIGLASGLLHSCSLKKMVGDTGRDLVLVPCFICTDELCVPLVFPFSRSKRAMVLST